MRHLKAGSRRFGRNSAHRKAMFRNMVTALIQRERIQTTLAKAKELRGRVEKVITLGKKGTVHARRMALRHVAQRATVQKLFADLSERYAGRPGGYTRIIKIGNRRGDDAPMALIELVDREGEAESPGKGKEKKKDKPKKTEGKKNAASKKEVSGKTKTKKASEGESKKPAETKSGPGTEKTKGK